MVMETTPSPQCVGREFVRQYYTLLNKAPLHLHRFYSQNSSFLHGGLDRNGQDTKPVVGQQDIHDKIMQLNFKDCHAKIRQVDSHETLASGVVVQVTGELSNNGQPMRRFMQTFVLAPQSPKKYYVRNDIFRYQDEIFTDDDEGENENTLADNDVDETTKQPSVPIQDNETVPYYEAEIVRNGIVHAPETVTKFPPPQVPTEITNSPQIDQDVESPKSEWEDEEEEEELEEEEEELEETSITIERTTENNVSPETENIAPVSQEPKTYANMVSRNTSSNVANVVPSSTTTSPTATQPINAKTEQNSAFYKSEVGVSPPSHNTPQLGSFGPTHRQSRPRLNSGRNVPPPVPPQQRYEGRDNTTCSPEDFDADKRKPPFIHYPDSQQLFVGNLTHSITEEDLKSHFTQFGKVLDMRINTKQNQKAGGAKVPNFGFIVFEDPESVQKVLNKRPIFFNDHRLNVEEKKRPNDKRTMPGDNRIGPGRGGMPPRVMGNRGGRSGMLGPQGAGRGDARGGMKGGGFVPRRSP